MPELDAGQLRTAYRAISREGAPARPTIDQLHARIDARRRKSRTRRAAIIGAAALILIAVAVGLSGGHAQRVSTVATGPAGSTAAFCAAARSIERANAAPMSSIPSHAESETRERSQILTLLPAAAPNVQAALRVEVAVLDRELNGGGQGTGEPTKAQIDAAATTVGQALRRDCGLTISIFGYSVKPTSPQSTFPTSSSMPSQAGQGMCRLMKLKDAEKYVGLSVAAARSLALGDGGTVRVVNQDGHPIGGTADRVLGRVDVSVESGRVVAACSE